MPRMPDREHNLDGGSGPGPAGQGTSAPLAPGATEMMVGRPVAKAAEASTVGLVPVDALTDDPRRIDFHSIKPRLLTEARLFRMWDDADEAGKVALMEGFSVLATRLAQGARTLDRIVLRDLGTALNAGGDLALEASRVGTRWRDLVLRVMKGEQDHHAALRLSAAQAASAMVRAGYPMIQAAETLCVASRDRERAVRQAVADGLASAEQWAEKLASGAQVWGVDAALPERATQGIGTIILEEIRVARTRLTDGTSNHNLG